MRAEMVLKITEGDYAVSLTMAQAAELLSYLNKTLPSRKKPAIK